jgi:DNA-binding beta-propeller fold protein YncE
VVITPDGKTAFVANTGSDSASTIDVKTRTKDLDDSAAVAPRNVAP